MKQVIIDTDIGGDPDDLCALLLALRSPELHIDLIVTNDEYGQKRAVYAKEFLSLVNREIPVVSGAAIGPARSNKNFFFFPYLFFVAKTFRSLSCLSSGA